MRIEHQELVHLVTQHYYVNSVEKMDDLNQRDQRQIAIAGLKDDAHFDACEILLYHNDPARNMIAVLEDYEKDRLLPDDQKKLTADDVVNKIFSIIINAQRPEIDKIFQEFADHQYWETKTQKQYFAEQQQLRHDAIYGFI